MARSQNSFERIFPREGETKRTDSPPSVHELFAMTMRDELSASQFAEALVSLHGDAWLRACRMLRGRCGWMDQLKQPVGYSSPVGSAEWLQLLQLQLGGAFTWATNESEEGFTINNERFVISGEGSFGSVYRCSCEGHQLAVKILSTERIAMMTNCSQDIVLRRMLQEPEILGCLGGHPNIVQLRCAAVSQQTLRIYIVMQLLECSDLFTEMLRRRQPFKERDAREDTFVTPFVIKLIDFGQAIMHDQRVEQMTSMAKTLTTTSVYTPPEPGEFEKHPLWKRLSIQAQDLIRGLLEPDPQKRLSSKSPTPMDRESEMQVLLSAQSLNKALQRERGSSCWLISGHTDAESACIWFRKSTDEAFEHVEDGDGRVSEIARELLKLREFTARLRGCCNLRSNMPDAFPQKFDEVFSGYCKLNEDLINLIGSLLVAFKGNGSVAPSAVELKLRMLLHIAEQLGRERGFMSFHIGRPELMHSLSAQLRFAKIQGCRQYLVGSSSPYTQREVVSTADGLLPSLRLAEEPVLSASEIAALERAEEEVMAGKADTFEWFAFLTGMIDKVHQHVSMTVVLFVQDLTSVRVEDTGLGQSNVAVEKVPSVPDAICVSGAARLLSSVDAGCGRLVFRQFQKALQEDSLEPVAVSGRPNVFVDQAKGIMLDNAGSPTPPALRGDNSRPHTDISREDFVKANQLASKMQALGPFRSNLVVPSNDPSINNPLVPHEEQSDDTGRDTMRTATRMFISGELDRASYEQFLTQQGVLLTSDCDLQKLIVSHERDLIASRSWLAKLGGRRLKAPKARRVVPTVARWLADRGALTAKGERLKGERASLSNVVPLPPAPVVHLLGAKTNPRRPRRAQSARALSARSEVAKEHPHGHTWSSGPWLNRLPDRKWHLRQASISASLASMAYHGSLNQSDTSCAHVRGQSVAKLLEVVKCPLRHFDISDNALGDAAAAQICDSLRQACRASLQGLRMAKNLLGSARFGVSVQALLPQAVHLQALDLHWNKIDGGDACAIFQGLKANSRRKGKLSSVNLAWNCIGLRCFAATTPNHTLFGLHLAGNGAYVDDIGMVRPQLEHRGAPREVEELLQRERVRRQLDGWVRSMPQQLRPERMGRFIEEVKLANEPFSPSLRRAAWMRNDQTAMRMSIPLAFALLQPAFWSGLVASALDKVEKSDVFSDGDLGLEKAWISFPCTDQLQELQLYAPTFGFFSFLQWLTLKRHGLGCMPKCSLHPSPRTWKRSVQLKAAAGFVKTGWSKSVDGFSRPSRLNRSLERFWARDFVDVSAESEWTRRPFLDDGRLICFRGSRMLPPSYERIHVIFQVNEEICCAKHLPIVPLFSETYVQLHWDGRPNLQDPLPPLPTPLDREPVEIAQANEIDVHTHANAVFEQGAADALFVLDRLWRKLQKDRPYDVAAVLNVLESHYESFMAAYCFESTMDCSGKSCGLSLATFSRLLLGSDATQDSRNLFDVSPHSSSQLLKARASLPSTLDESHPLNEGFNFGKADAIYTAVLFLVCTTAAVYLSGDFPEEELADRLLDFILDVLPQALEAGRAAEMQEVGYLTSGGDPRTLQLVGLLTRIFNDADEDGSGWLTVQEFFQALQQPRIIASLEELGVVVGDVKLLFLRMDVDDSGEISLREFIEGLLKLRNDMIDKGIRAVRKAFLKLETKYGTGNVTKDQFLEYAKNPRNADALEKAGIRDGPTDLVSPGFLACWLAGSFCCGSFCWNV
eukprot:g29092.t1